MRFIEKIRKNSNGSITIFVLTSLLFVLVVIGVFYVGISNKNVNQTKIINQIENEYLE